MLIYNYYIAGKNCLLLRNKKDNKKRKNPGNSSYERKEYNEKQESKQTPVCNAGDPYGRYHVPRNRFCGGG